MSTEMNKAIVRRILEEYWHRGDESVLDELFTPDFVNHDRSKPPLHGLAAFKAWANAVRATNAIGIPDVHFTIEDLIAEGDRVTKRYVARGTHTGELAGFPPTGRAVMIRAASIYHFRDGKVSEIWWNYDAAGLLEQLRPAEAVATA